MQTVPTDDRQSRPQASHRTPNAGAGPLAELVRLAHESTTRPSFYAAALACIGRTFHSPYAAVYVRLAAEVVQDEYHSGPTDPGFWRSEAQRYLTASLPEGRTRARLLSARDARLKVAVVSAPLLDAHAAPCGAIAVVAPLDDDDDPRSCITRLESLAALTSYLAHSIGSASSLRAPTEPKDYAQSLARAAGFGSPEELAFGLTNNLRNKLGCELVALGLVRGRRVRVLNVSGLDHVSPRSPGIVQIQSAMEECLDASVPIVAQRDSGWCGPEEQAAHRLHRQWHDATHGASVASIPLCVGDEIAAILSVRRRAEDPFTHEQIERIRTAVEPYAAALRLVARARRGLLRHARDSIGAAARTVLGRGRLGQKAALVLVALTAVWFVFGAVDYELSATGVVAPARTRHVSAPFEGVIDSITVVPGDRVRAGEILCVLDRRDLELQREQLRAELAVSAQSRQKAMAESAPVDARLAEANERLLAARLAVLERRIEQATLRSPIDGVVVAGDLRPRVRGVIRQGETLLQVAPLDGWIVELAIPQSMSADLKDGLRGRFASHARPDEVQEFRVARTRPRAETRDARNVFIAEAPLDPESAPWLRAGMEGTARVSAGRRPVWWVALHRVINALHEQFWL